MLARRWRRRPAREFPRSRSVPGPVPGGAGPALLARQDCGSRRGPRTGRPPWRSPGPRGPADEAPDHRRGAEGPAGWPARMSAAAAGAGRVQRAVTRRATPCPLVPGGCLRLWRYVPRVREDGRHRAQRPRCPGPVRAPAGSGGGRARKEGLHSGWDFFVSYTHTDRAWAEWIAWVLEEDGHQVLIQAWDFVPGSNLSTGSRGCMPGHAMPLARSPCFPEPTWDRCMAAPRGRRRWPPTQTGQAGSCWSCGSLLPAAWSARRDRRGGPVRDI